MDTFKGFTILLGKELREAQRTNRLLIVGAIYLFFGISSPLLAKYLPDLLKGQLAGGIKIEVPPPTTADAVDQFLKNLGNTVFVAILLTMGAVAREKEHGTITFVMTKPVGRGAFLAAKFAALVLLFAFGLLLAALPMYGYTAYLFSALPLGGFALSCGLQLLATLVYTALTFLGSTLMRSALPAAGIGIAAFIVLAILGALPQVGRFTPGALTAPARALALGTGPEHLAAALLGNSLVLALALALAWIAFQAQELGS